MSESQPQSPTPEAQPVSTGEATLPFWMSARRFTTPKRIMTGAEIRELTNSTEHGHVFQDMFGKEPDKVVGDGVAWSMENEPHFYVLLPATGGHK